MYIIYIYSLNHFAVYLKHCKSTILQILKKGDPTAVQPDQPHLWSSGMQAQSLAWHSGLRVWHYCSCCVGCNYGSHLIPVQGIPCAVGRPQGKKNNIRSDR